MNSNSSENRQKEIKTDNINSSAKKTGITDINMPAIYENLNDNKIINLEAHKLNMKETMKYYQPIEKHLNT